MNHQPFDTWIFTEEELSEQEKSELDEHLQACAQCQKLSRGWKAAFQEIHATAVISPAAGFSQRWQYSLAGRRIRQQQRQARLFFLLLAGTALAVLLSLGIHMVATTSPLDWAIAGFQLVIHVIQRVDEVQTFVNTWIPSIPVFVPIILWIFLSSTLCFLTIGWVFSIWRISSKGGLRR